MLNLNVVPCEACRKVVSENQLAPQLARDLEHVEEVATKLSNRVTELEQAINAVCQGTFPVALLHKLLS
jgi:uncharacterized protein YaaN involved in tellurite resistance